MERHEIGEYSTASGDILTMYMLQFPTGRSDNGHVVPAAVTYCMEARNADPLLFWRDWLQFAHAINRIAGEVVLDIHEDPAVCDGLVVPVGLECPDCGCRVMDELVWIEDDRLMCGACKTTYTPGEN